MIYGRDLGFQSPIHRGMDCNYLTLGQSIRSLFAFSPLFIGEWIATEIEVCHEEENKTFSPLFIGEWIVTIEPIPDRCTAHSFSPLFIGEWIVTTLGNAETTALSVPYSSGNGLQHEVEDALARPFQSPIHRGMDCNCGDRISAGWATVLSVPYSSGNGLQHV